MIPEVVVSPAMFTQRAKCVLESCTLSSTEISPVKWLRSTKQSLADKPCFSTAEHASVARKHPTASLIRRTVSRARMWGLLAHFCPT